MSAKTIKEAAVLPFLATNPSLPNGSAITNSYDSASNLQYRTNDILSGSPLKLTFSADSRDPISDSQMGDKQAVGIRQLLFGNHS